LAALFSSFRLFQRLLVALFCLSPALGLGQTLTVHNSVQTFSTLTNTVVTMTGRSELRITGAADPITGCTIHLNSPDAWFYMTSVQPQTLSSTFLSRVRVNGANAALNTNVRIVQYGMGAVVIPHAADFSPLEVFDARHFAGNSKSLYQYVAYDDVRLGAMKGAIRSFKLKHGYMATLAENENGSGFSKNYVAQDGDLEVGRLPDDLDRDVHFVRVFPWRWAGKKGVGGNIEQNLNIRWLYNWNIDRTSPLNWEYVPIRHTRWWPGLDQDWKSRGATHLLGFNEPDHAQQANLSVAEAISAWPDLLATGLRVGAPAITDGGTSWISDFIAQADAAGLRVDFVPVHYYRSYWNAADPAGAATQFYNFLKGIHDIVKRPLWVTEFNNGANWTTDPDPTAAQQAATVAAMIEMLDNAPFVERYAIYNWVEDVRRVVWDDNWPTQAGEIYRDKSSPIAYRQEMADAGTGNSARYAFDGDAYDSWGNGQDGMTVGAPIFVAGKHGQAIALNGTSDYVQLSPRIGDTTSFTFAAWVFWNGGANWQRIFDFGLGESNYLALTPKSGGNTMRFLMRDGGAEQQLNTTPLPAGVWTHVAVTITGDTGKLFVNGALVNTNTAMTINPVDVDTKFNYLGKSQFADPLFNGRLDDVRIVSSALTDAEIAAIATTPPPQFSSPTLVKPAATEQQPYTESIALNAAGGSGTRIFAKMSGPAWLAVAQDGSLTGVPTFSDGGINRFLVRVTDANGSIHTAMLEIPVVEASGITARYAFDSNVDSSVGTAHGIAAGTPAYTLGRNGSAIDLDGTDDFVTLPAGTASSDELTIAVWVNWDGGGNWQRIFDFGNGTSEYFFLTPKSGSNTLRFSIASNGAEQQLNTTSLPLAQWTHVAVTLSAGTGRLYVNGTLVNTAAMANLPSVIAPATNLIGKSQFAADPLFNGRLDDLLIFNEALTASQLAALMNGPAPAFSSDPITKPSAAPGLAYNHSLALNVTDPDSNSTFQFSKVSGPSWLTVAADGRISGLPAVEDAGLNRFMVRVTDGTHLAADAVMNIPVSSASGLVAHYQFDGSLTNSSGGGAGTPSGSPVYESGVFDRALRFDGTDDSVALPSNVVGALTDATFAVRVRWDGGAAWQRIFDFGAGTAQYMILTPSSGSGTTQFAILNSGGTTQRLAGPDPLPIGEWTHVAVTLAGNTGTLYVNGAAVASTSITVDPGTITQTANFLGDSQFTADPLFAGTLDEFRIYNRGLTPDEVRALALPLAPIAVPLDYLGWTTGIAFPGGQSGALEDPDRDGVQNAFEFLLGFNPLTSSIASLPTSEIRTGAQLGIVGDPAKRYLTMEVRARKSVSGTTLVAEGAPTIPGLDAADAANHVHQAGPAIPDGEFEIITYYYDVPIDDSPSATGVMRLRATGQ
jgi:hypothetical protein